VKEVEAEEDGVTDSAIVGARSRCHVSADGCGSIIVIFLIVISWLLRRHCPLLFPFSANPSPGTVRHSCVCIVGNDVLLEVRSLNNYSELFICASIVNNVA
jgi:hypothetical protein